MTLAPATMGAVVDAARAHAAASHGQRTRIVEQLAEQLGCSVATAYEHIRTAGVMSPRKRRRDAGEHTLTRDEAVTISALIEETRRETGTGQLSVSSAVEILLSAGRITAGHVDRETGEWSPLSVSAILRALRTYHVHPAQLSAPTPATRLSSPHPNWCWQVDASVSRQFYLADDGTKVMPAREFYRGKPQNFQAIADRRLWRYAITDHASGYIEVLYVQGAESAANLIAALIHAMTRRDGGCMHGLPRYVMADPGSAVTAAATKTFLRELQIDLIVNAVGNARAKGQVENANYLIETNFEAALKLAAPVSSCTQINALAARWAQAYNASKVHSRHGMTRRDAWLRITAEQLRLAPAVEVLRALPHSKPKSCVVRDYQIQFGGQAYDLRELAGVLNGQRVEAARNPFDQDSVRVLVTGADGRPGHFIAPRIGLSDTWRFQHTAAEIGTEYRGVPETPVDAARKSIERTAMQAQTDAAAAQKRKARQLAFGGEIDPMAHLQADKVVPHLPRAAQASTVTGPAEIARTPLLPSTRPVAAAAQLDLYALAKAIKPLVEARGGTWGAELYGRLAARCPDGAPEDQVDALAIQLMAPVLRVAGGAA